MHVISHKTVAKLFFFNILNCQSFTFKFVCWQSSFSPTVDRLNGMKPAAKYKSCHCVLVHMQHTNNRDPDVKTVLSKYSGVQVRWDCRTGKLVIILVYVS